MNKYRDLNPSAQKNTSGQRRVRREAEREREECQRLEALDRAEEEDVFDLAQIEKE